MKTQILTHVEGAQQATGLTVIIDVLRAFSVACYAFANGAARIIPVGDIELARQLGAANSDYLLIGERKGADLPDFHFGNSPLAIQGVDFSGKTMVHTTSNGTKGLVNATQADEVVTGAFVNAEAIVRYIQQRQPEVVSLVAMGSPPGNALEEDVALAEYIQQRLAEQQPDFAALKADLRHSITGQKFFDPDVLWLPEEDFDLCLTLDRFDFVLVAEPFVEGLLSLRRVTPE